MEERIEYASLEEQYTDYARIEVLKKRVRDMAKQLRTKKALAAQSPHTNTKLPEL